MIAKAVLYTDNPFLVEYIPEGSPYAVIKDTAGNSIFVVTPEALAKLREECRAAGVPLWCYHQYALN